MSASSLNTRVEFTTGSKGPFLADKLLLFDADIVSQLSAMATQAAVKLQGVHSGIGFWGSPGWVFGGALLLGALESLASKSAAEEGLSLLQQVAIKQTELRKSGQLFAVADVANVEFPVPASWMAFGRRDERISLSELQFREQLEIAAKDNIWAHETHTMRADSETAYTHSGEEFVGYSIEGELRYVRWASVSSYRVIASS